MHADTNIEGEGCRQCDRYERDLERADASLKNITRQFGELQEELLARQSRLEQAQTALRVRGEDYDRAVEMMRQVGEERETALSSRLDFVTDENRAQAAVIKDLEASNTDLIFERNDAVRGLGDAESRLNGIKALRVEMVDLIGADLDATLQGLLWPKDVERGTTETRAHFCGGKPVYACSYPECGAFHPRDCGLPLPSEVESGSSIDDVTPKEPPPMQPLPDGVAWVLTDSTLGLDQLNAPGGPKPAPKG